VSTLLRALPRHAAFTISATVGCLIYYPILCPTHWLATRFSRTAIGRHSFVLFTRFRLGPHLLLVLGALATGFAILASLPWGIALGVLSLPSLVVLSTYQRRILSVSNRGLGRLNVHLNRLAAERGRAMEQWRGVFEELDQLAHIAHAARVRLLSFESPILVSDTTTVNLQRKLQRIFAKRGLNVVVSVGPARPSGVLRSGLNHVLFRHHKGLKEYRRVYHAPLNRMTREITVRVSSAA
jgi:hypothetical protein